MTRVYHFARFTAIFALFLCFTLISNASTASNGLIFRIDIGTFDQKINPDELVGFDYRIEERDQGFNYQVGEYQDYIKAQRARVSLKEIGFESSEVVAFFNQNPISMDDAFTLMDNANARDEAAYHAETPSVSVEDLNKTIDNYNQNVYYSVQIGVYSSQKSEDDFELPEEVVEGQTSNGNYRYTTGKFLDYDEAKAKAMQLQEVGIADAFVVAFRNGQKVSLPVVK